MRTEPGQVNRWVALIATMTFLLALLVIPGLALAAKGGVPGPPDGGEEAAGNNLSLPGITLLAASADPALPASWAPPPDPATGTLLGTHYSYGCAKPQKEGTYSYPNTSCVDDLMNPTAYYTAAECTAEGYPCFGYAVDRMYWQKVDANNWTADLDNQAGYPALVDFVDWGDALEGTVWSEVSKIRVETQPYSTTIGDVYIPFDPTAETCVGAAMVAEDDCKVGFQMWHVSGQGITEQWGARATEEAVSYNYDSPFQIIKSSNAMLNIAKMSPLTAECPSSGGGDEGEEPAALAVYVAPGSFVWNDTNKTWEGGDEATVDPCTRRNDPYSVELSVGGKFVYGYNLSMQTMDLASCPKADPTDPPWVKTGWWRLTFYTTDDLVDFYDAGIPVTAPPAPATEARVLPRTAETFITTYATAGEPASETLFGPMVDATNDLTYIDICISPKVRGGGGGNSNRPGGPK